MVAKIAIAIGSNLGDRAAHLAAGLGGLAARGVVWQAVSSLYETEPVGSITNQPPFLNQVAVGETIAAPGTLLELCLAVEREQARVRIVRGGPRTLDLDILLYDGQQVLEPGLVVPHPEMTRRAFVLVPLDEVAPDWRVPGVDKTVRELLQLAPGREGVRWRSSAMKPPM